MKQELRDSMRAKRAAISVQDSALAAEALARVFLSSVTLKPGSMVAGYWPVRGEMDVMPLLKGLIGLGHHAALPCVGEKDTALTFHAWDPTTPMREGAFGIPCPDSAAVTPDIVLVPMLGFDGEGHRLGYGAGFYDRTLAAMTGAMAVGIAYEAQKLERLPAESYDVAMHMIITEKQAYTFGKTKA